MRKPAISSAFVLLFLVSALILTSACAPNRVSDSEIQKAARDLGVSPEKLKQEVNQPHVRRRSIFGGFWRGFIRSPGLSYTGDWLCGAVDLITATVNGVRNAIKERKQDNAQEQEIRKVLLTNKELWKTQPQVVKQGEKAKGLQQTEQKESVKK